MLRNIRRRRKTREDHNNQSVIHTPFLLCTLVNPRNKRSNVKQGSVKLEVVLYSGRIGARSWIIPEARLVLLFRANPSAPSLLSHPDTEQNTKRVIEREHYVDARSSIWMDVLDTHTI